MMLLALGFLFTSPSFANQTSKPGQENTPSLPSMASQVENSVPPVVIPLDASWHLDENGVPLQGIDLFNAARQLHSELNDLVEKSVCYEAVLERTADTCERWDRGTAVQFPGFRMTLNCTSGGETFVVASKDLEGGLSAADGEFLCEDEALIFHAQKAADP